CALPICPCRNCRPRTEHCSQSQNCTYFSLHYLYAPYLPRTVQKAVSCRCIPLRTLLIILLYIGNFSKFFPEMQQIFFFDFITFFLRCRAEWNFLCDVCGKRKGKPAEKGFS